MHQSCTCTGFWIVWIRTPVVSNRDQEWGFLCCARSRIGFFVCWKNVTGCLLDLYLRGVKQESDFLCHVGTGSGRDSDWKLANQVWIPTKKNQSPDTSTMHTARDGDACKFSYNAIDSNARTDSSVTCAVTHEKFHHLVEKMGNDFTWTPGISDLTSRRLLARKADGIALGQ